MRILRHSYVSRSHVPASNVFLPCLSSANIFMASMTCPSSGDSNERGRPPSAKVSAEPDRLLKSL